MAKNYTIKEAVEIVVEGKDLEQIMDIGKRYPLLAVKIAAIGAKAGDEFVDFMQNFPDHVTANKINTVIKNGLQESDADDSDDNEDADETPKAKIAKPAKKAPVDEEEGAGEYESMTGNALVELCKERGIWKTLKDKKKAGMIAALEEYDANGGESDEEEAEESGNPYEGKSAMELFKECKKRGIKAAPKKPAKVYADMLMKADAAEADEDGDNEDWGDEEEEAAPEPKKTPAKKAPAKEAPKAKAAKAAKKDEAEEDDGDDWDI